MNIPHNPKLHKHIARQRFGRLNWRFIGLIILASNLASLADGDFFNWKMNGGILLMIVMAAYMYE